MPSYAFPVVPPSPYTEKAAARPYSAHRNKLQSTFSHPDSDHGYVAVSKTNTSHEPLGSHTKKTITVFRGVQLGLRISQSLGAIGLLVCTACTTNLDDQQSFYLRTPPCIDLLITTYAIYHLARAATYSPAGTSSSYHFFALIIDACLIPFYIFITFLARSEFANAITGNGLWTSVFGIAIATENLITATWLISVIVAGFHVLTLLLSMYLCLAFRRIARLPPGMNPLEAHLTSRPRKSLAPSLNAAKETGYGVRPISFFKTRLGGKNKGSHYTAATSATASRLNLDLPPLPSTEDMTNDRALGTQSMSKRSLNNRHNFSSIRSILKGSSLYSLNLYDEFITPPLPRRSSKRRSEVPSEASSTRDMSPQRDDRPNLRISVVKEEVDHEDETQHNQSYGFLEHNSYRNSPYQTIPQTAADSQVDNGKRAFFASHDITTLQPLQMNPPTPRLTTFTHIPPHNSSPDVPPRSPTRKPKTPSYGDLTSNVSSGDLGTSDSIISDNTPWYSPAQSPIRSKKEGKVRVISRSGADLGDASIPHTEQFSNQYNLQVDQIHDGASDTSSGLGYKGASGVVVNGLRGRNVSGKVAEEGRGGGGSDVGHGDYLDPIGGVANAAAGDGGSWSGRWFRGRGW